jgi:hypothetical protein
VLYDVEGNDAVSGLGGLVVNTALLRDLDRALTI